METTKMTAAQRLEGLEQAIALTDQAMGNMATNLQTSINALTLLSKKLDAIIRLGDAGKQITSSAVAAEIVEINVQELIEKVQDLKEKGVAVDSETIEDNSFIVGRELDPQTKEVVNKRMQFPLFGLKQDKKDLLIGKRPGDIVSLETGRNLLEIMEVYSIVVPTASDSEAAESETEQAEEQLAQGTTNS